MQKASGRAPEPQLVDARFQVCFTPLAGVLFAFPSRYWFAIGHHLVFRLGGWSPRIRAGFHVSRPTWDTGRPRAGFRLRGSHPLWLRFPADSPNLARATARSRNPGMQASRFGLVRFRSCAFARHYSRNRVCFPFLGVLRCFTSPGVARNGLFDSSARAALWKAAGFPIRTSADQSLLTAPRGLSQSAASFIASWCQGIHRAPVYA